MANIYRVILAAWFALFAVNAAVAGTPATIKYIADDGYGASALNESLAAACMEAESNAIADHNSSAAGAPNAPWGFSYQGASNGVYR